jgi:hypothetical protein
MDYRIKGMLGFWVVGLLEQWCGGLMELWLVLLLIIILQLVNCQYTFVIFDILFSKCKKAGLKCGGMSFK